MRRHTSAVNRRRRGTSVEIGTCAAIVVFTLGSLTASSYRQTNLMSRVADEAFYFTSHWAMVEESFKSPLTNSFEVSIMNRGLTLLGLDFLTNLFVEIRGPVFRTLVTEEVRTGGSSERLPEFRAGVWVGPSDVSIRLFAGGKRNGAYARFEQRVRFYISARAEGHSSNYVYWAIQESKGTNYSTLPPGFPLWVKSRYWIPSYWINPTNVWSGVVVDGKLAWSYAGLPVGQRRDAQEYDPELKTKFADARQEAVRDLKSRGIFLEPGILDIAIKRVMKQKYNIDWLTPQELEFFRP